MKTRILILAIFAAAFLTVASHAQSSFISTLTEAGSVIDYGNAITHSGNYIYVTGKKNSDLFVKRYTKGTFLLDATWTPNLGALPNGAANKTGYDIEYYNNAIYVTASDYLYIYIMKLTLRPKSLSRIQKALLQTTPLIVTM